MIITQFVGKDYLDNKISFQLNSGISEQTINFKINGNITVKALHIFVDTLQQQANLNIDVIDSETNESLYTVLDGVPLSAKTMTFPSDFSEELSSTEYLKITVKNPEGAVFNVQGYLHILGPTNDNN